MSHNVVVSVDFYSFIASTVIVSKVRALQAVEHPAYSKPVQSIP